MSSSKEQLFSSFKELQIDFAQHDHLAGLTVEAQAEYIGHMKGGLSKNLFLKDKKHRFYIVSALKDTKVDLKVLSQRLGLGKGGLSFASEEKVAEILKVPLDCVTPFALVNESARHVSLLLDQGFKTHECCFFHPLSNDKSISLNACDLDKFLESIGKDPTYVDLEANPPVGKDQPPDLAAYVPLPKLTEKAASLQVHEKNNVIVNNKSTAVRDPLPSPHLRITPQRPLSHQRTTKLKETSSTSPYMQNTLPLGSTALPSHLDTTIRVRCDNAVEAVKPSNSSQEKSTNAVSFSSSFTNPEKFVEEILEKVSAIVLSELKEENIKQHGEQLGAVVSSIIKNNLSSDLKNLTTIFKNTAYTEGFYAGTHSQPKRL